MNKLLKYIAFTLLLVGCKPVKPVDFNFNPEIDTTSLSGNYATYNNSFDSAQIPNQWPNYGIGDPFVYRYNGTYYLYPSTSDRGVRGYKSIDLMNWEPVTGDGLPYGYVLSPDYVTETTVAYAPEVTYYDGWFYLCESQAGTGHYFFRSRSPEGPFVPYTGNVGESIDGSFFIDDDGQAYFLRAKAETIRITTFNDDFTLSNEAFDIENTSMGGWTEGPYVLKRNGIYYLTFTGVHVASHGYKVGYSYLKDASSVFSRYDYTRGDNFLINTDDEWHTLGHSSTTMGPDMDSYYIAYHSRSNGVWGRQFNLSRLLFNGTEMTVDRASLRDTLVPNMPAFYTHLPAEDMQTAGEFLLSPEKTKEIFTAEYNFMGQNPKLAFSYQDDENYHYISTDGLNISLYEVKGGSSKKLTETTLDHQYDMNALHNIRIAYRSGKINLSFDNMEKISNHEITLAPGKIGYFGSGYERHFTAFSNVARGLSDQEYAKQQTVYANAYEPTISSLNKSKLIEIENSDENEEFNGKVGSGKLQLANEEYASYKIYATNSGTYQITMRVDNASLGKKIALKIDNNEPLELVIPSVETTAPFVNVTLTNINLSKGAHYLSVLNRQNSAFVRLDFKPTSLQEEIYQNDLKTDTFEFISRGSPYTYTPEGLMSSANRSLAYLNKDGLDNVEISVEMRFEEASSIYSSGIVVRAKNDAYGTWDDQNSLQGYYFGVKNTQAFLMRADYQAMSRQLAINFATVPSLEFTKLRIVANGNTLSFYVNDVEEFVVIDPDALYGGRIGLYTTGVPTTFRNLVITPI